MSWGLTSAGFQRPSLQEILESLKARLRAKTWRDEDGQSVPGSDLDLTNPGPLAQIVESVTGELDILHQEIEAVYGANKVGSASGQALSDLVSFQRLSRDPALKAQNVVTMSGSAGSVIEAGKLVSASETDLQYVTTEERVVEAGGSVDVLVEALAEGPEYNCASGAIDTIDDEIGGAESVINQDHAARLVVADSSNASHALAVDAGVTDYQTIRLADIAHPHKLTKIEMKLENDSGESITAQLHAVIFDHLTGAQIAKTHTLSQVFADSSEAWVTFDGLEIDAHNAGATLRVALVNELTSTGAPKWLANSSGPYSGGAFYLNGAKQVGHDAMLRITSETVGAFSNGQDEESDAELVNRFLVSKGRGAAAIPRKIVADVWAVPGVRSVGFRQNREDTEVADLRRRSVELTVLGGAVADIAECLFDVVAAGIRTEGNITFDVEDDYGQTHEVRFYRPTSKPVYVVLTLTKGASFSASSGDDQVRDAVAGYVGGIDTEGTLVAGLSPGDDVIVSKIIDAVMSVEGVEDVSVTLGFAAEPEGTVNLAIAANELATVEPALIEVAVI